MEEKKSAVKKNQRIEKNKKEPSLLADIPLGLSSALSRNMGAMKIFAEMPDEQRQQVIEGAHAIKSKDEMRSYVASITKSNVSDIT